MPYLAPEFRSDVFVSYSHGKKENGRSRLKTWSFTFAKMLETELRESPYLSNVDVYVDDSDRPEQGLDIANGLTAQLRDAASGSALLLVLMSPQYVKSSWCVDERNWWRQQSPIGAVPGVESRVLVARIWPIETDQWPADLCDERGHPPVGIAFHDYNPNKHEIRPLGWPDLKQPGDDFNQTLVQLAGQIARRLEKMHDFLKLKRKAAEEAAWLTAEAGQAIFVHARMRNKQRWEEACHRLLSAGYGVFPNGPEALAQDPAEALQTEKEVVRTIGACDGLLLLPDDDLKSFNSDVLVIGHQLRNSAKAASRKPLPCAVLDPGLAIDHKPRLQQSVKNLNIHWIDGVAGDWTTAIKPWLSAAAVRSGA